MVKLFMTGATGFIGGDALYAITKAHPEYEITALVRDAEKGAKVTKEYPNVKLVYGELDSTDVIEEESKKSDIVCHFAHAAHTGSAAAMAKGLQGHHSSRPGFFIHTSGAGILLIEDIIANTFGDARSKIYNDLEGVKEVTSLPDNPLRAVDKIVLAAGTDHSDRVKTAIVCPPTIYGAGRGPCNKKSHQVPALCASTLKQGQALQVNSGKNFWGNVHIHDLSDLYIKLIENAAAGGIADAELPAIWGDEGYFFAENGEHVWGDVAQWIATEAFKQSLVESDQVKSITPDEANKLTFWGSGLWGANSRSRAKRARQALSWTPSGPSLRDTIKASLELEAKSLCQIPGHGKVCGVKRSAAEPLNVAPKRATIRA